MWGKKNLKVIEGITFLVLNINDIKIILFCDKHATTNWEGSGSTPACNYKADSNIILHEHFDAAALPANSLQTTQFLWLKKHGLPPPLRRNRGLLSDLTSISLSTYSWPSVLQRTLFPTCFSSLKALSLKHDHADHMKSPNIAGNSGRGRSCLFWPRQRLMKGDPQRTR